MNHLSKMIVVKCLMLWTRHSWFGWFHLLVFFVFHIGTQKQFGRMQVKIWLSVFIAFFLWEEPSISFHALFFML